MSEKDPIHPRTQFTWHSLDSDPRTFTLRAERREHGQVFYGQASLPTHMAQVGGYCQEWEHHQSLQLDREIDEAVKKYLRDNDIRPGNDYDYDGDLHDTYIKLPDDHAVHIKIHNELRKTYKSTLLSEDPQDKEDLMSINKHDLYLTPGEEWDIRNGNQATAHAAIVRILPPVIQLNTGDVVRFDGDEKYDYKIVLIHDDDLVVQRLVGNSAGDAGEPVPAKVSDYVEKIRRGRAEVVG